MLPAGDFSLLCSFTPRVGRFCLPLVSWTVIALPLLDPLLEFPGLLLNRLGLLCGLFERLKFVLVGIVCYAMRLADGLAETMIVITGATRLRSSHDLNAVFNIGNLIGARVREQPTLKQFDVREDLLTRIE